MRIVFMGTPDFAVSCLEALIENKYNVVAVVSQPDKPKGRGNKLSPTPVKELALHNNIEVFQPEKAKDPEFIEKLKEINPDLIVVVAYGHILPKSILDIPRLGCINIHGSLLPSLRGAAPIQWSIINGDKVTGVTSMYMDVGMDTGDMILKRETEILKEDNLETLFNKLSGIGAKILIETVKLIEEGKAPREKQDDARATFAPMLDKNIGHIDWNKNTKEIFDLVRGTYPWPGSFTYYHGQKMKIFNIEIEDRIVCSKAGKIVEISEEAIIVQCRDGLIKIKEIQLDSGKKMPVCSFLLGHAIELNVILE